MGRKHQGDPGACRLAWVFRVLDAAVERQIERDLLGEALLVNEAEAGPIPQELKDEAAALFRDMKSAPEL